MMATVECTLLQNQPGIFLSCSELADANDIVEYLDDWDGAWQRVGWTGIFIADGAAIDYLKTEMPGLVF